MPAIAITGLIQIGINIAGAFALAYFTTGDLHAALVAAGAVLVPLFQTAPHQQ